VGTHCAANCETARETASVARCRLKPGAPASRCDCDASSPHVDFGALDAVSRLTHATRRSQMFAAQHVPTLSTLCDCSALGGRVTAGRVAGVRRPRAVEDGRIRVHSLCAKVPFASIPVTTIRNDRISNVSACRVRSKPEPAVDRRGSGRVRTESAQCRRPNRSRRLIPASRPACGYFSSCCFIELRSCSADCLTSSSPTRR
jgi:hypothetical protein